MYSIELIPDQDLLYYRVHKSHIRDGNLQPGAYREKGEGDQKGMSTNWSKYSTPLATQNEANIPDDNGVVNLLTGSVREVKDLTVTHNPLAKNRAHSHVKGIPPKGVNKVRIRLLLSDLAEWEIKPSN